MSDMKNVAVESSNQAMQSFQEAVQAAAKVQEESIKGLHGVFNVALPAWQKAAETAEVVVRDMMAVARKNTEETLQAMGQGLKMGMNFWQKALEGRPEQAQPGKIQCEMEGFWKTIAHVTQANTEMMTRTNQRVMEAWLQVGKMAGDAQAEQSKRIAEAAQAT